MKQTLLILFFMVIMIIVNPLKLNGQWRARLGVPISQLNETQLREAIALNVKIKAFTGTVAILGTAGMLGGILAYESLKDLPDNNKMVMLSQLVAASGMLALAYGGVMYIVSATRKADLEIELFKKTGTVAIIPIIKKEFDLLTIGIKVGFIF